MFVNTGSLVSDLWSRWHVSWFHIWNEKHLHIKHLFVSLNSAVFKVFICENRKLPFSCLLAHSISHLVYHCRENASYSTLKHKCVPMVRDTVPCVLYKRPLWLLFYLYQVYYKDSLWVHKWRLSCLGKDRKSCDGICCCLFLLINYSACLPPHTFFSYHRLSHVVRLWYFSSSVISFFKCACAAIQWGLDVGFFGRTLRLMLRTARALARLRECAGSPELHRSPMW